MNKNDQKSLSFLLSAPSQWKRLSPFQSSSWAKCVLWMCGTCKELTKPLLCLNSSWIFHSLGCIQPMYSVTYPGLQRQDQLFSLRFHGRGTCMLVFHRSWVLLSGSFHHLGYIRWGAACLPRTLRWCTEGSKSTDIVLLASLGDVCWHSWAPVVHGKVFCLQRMYGSKAAAALWWRASGSAPCALDSFIARSSRRIQPELILCCLMYRCKAMCTRGLEHEVMFIHRGLSAQWLNVNGSNHCRFPCG